MVKAREEALLELGRAQLVAAPSELLRHQDLHIESLPANGVEEVFADPFSLKERKGAAHGALQNLAELFGAQAHPVELLGSGWNSQADAKDALAGPVALRRLEAVERLSWITPTCGRGGVGLALVLPFEGDYDVCCARQMGWLLPPLERCD